MFGIALLVFLGAITWMVYAQSEPQNIRSDGVLARVFIPHAVRDFQWPDLCSPVRLSRSFQECTAGICGEAFTVQFSSKSSPESLQSAFEAFTSQAGDEGAFMSVDDDIGADGCRLVRAFVYHPYSEASE